MSTPDPHRCCPTCGGQIPAAALAGLCPSCLLAAAAMNEIPYPETIGPYRLLEPLGEGGMGRVFVAAQEYPIQRKVALKLIKPGMDSREVLSRFEAERQAVALMDQPGIARVFDAGATEDGRPYFVMELVNGPPLTEFCDGRKLSLRERLALFQQICHAVQHAHQKGIIHRDLKPSNILVAVDDDNQPVPKIIDFGVAKALGPNLNGESLFTLAGQLIGTPQYMSPEQAAFDARDVDTRSDIYALGILLYELLIGSTPLEAADLRKAGIDAILRTIREQDAPKPSTRFGLLADRNQSGIADSRQLQVSKLSQSLKGDLDWIVMKALEKERDRRYETASDFAQDIRRYLDDEPVSASPPSVAYKFGKFARRNKALMSGAAAVIVVLIVGIAATTWQAHEARLQRDRANQTRDAAEGLVSVMLNDLDEKLSSIGRLDLMEDVSKAADDYFDRLPKDQAAPRTSYLQAQALLNRAAVLHDKGDDIAEIQHVVEALGIARGLLATDAEDKGYLSLISSCYRSLIGRRTVGDSEKLSEEYMALGERLMARKERRSTDFMIAANAWLASIETDSDMLGRAGKALVIANEGNSAWPSDIGILNSKARAHYLLGRYEADLEVKAAAMEESIVTYRAISELRGPDHAEMRNSLAQVLQQSSWLLHTLGQRNGDAAMMQRGIDRQAEAIEVLEELYVLSPDDVTLRQSLAIAHHNYGKHILLAGDMETALQHWDQCLSHQEFISQRSPQNVGAMRDCLHQVQLMAKHLKDRGPEANEEAIRLIKRAFVLLDGFPEDLSAKIKLLLPYIQCIDYLGELQRNTHREIIDLDPELKAALGKLEGRLESSALPSQDPSIYEMHWLVCRRLAMEADASGQREEALAWLRKVEEAYVKISRTIPTQEGAPDWDPGSLVILRDLAKLYSSLQESGSSDRVRRLINPSAAR